MLRLTILAALAIACFGFAACAAISTVSNASDHQNQKAAEPNQKNAIANQTGGWMAAADPKQADGDAWTNNEKNQDGNKRPNWLRNFVAFIERHDKFWVAAGTIIIAAFTVILAISTIALWGVTWRASLTQARDMEESIGAAKAAADAAVESNKLNREIFIADQRPWLLVDVSIAGPLTYNVNGANFTISALVTNNGRLPATNVFIHVLIHAPAIGIDAQNPIKAKRDALISEIAARSQFPFGYTVFPGKAIAQNTTVSISKEELTRITQVAEVIIPTIIGSVSYFFAGDPRVHQTGFVRDIVRSQRPRPEATAKNRSPAAICPDEGDIPAADLVLLASILIGDYAD